MAPTCNKRPRSKHLAAASAKKKRIAEGVKPVAACRGLGKGSASHVHDNDAGHCPSRFGAMIDEGLDRFEKHYRLHRLVRAEADWAKLRNSLRQPLPVAFRLCAVVGADAERRAAAARGELDELLSKINAAGGCTTARGRFVPPPREFPFANAFSLGCDAKVLRQEQQEAPHALLARLAGWLGRQVQDGLASRQEIVSAVPVAVLSVGHGHRVLDMCASPGSKTLQALEKVGVCGGVRVGELTSEACRCQGAVVANELSAARAHILSSRCARGSGAACAGLAVVQHPAQVFPGPTDIFDRIICDVPCSGDGAIRKYPEKWRDWSPHVGRALHSRQLQIALRAAALLRVGGLMT